MKYFTINNFDVYMFSPHISHERHLAAIGHTVGQVSGAGFWTPDRGCHGFSDSLNIGPGVLDNELIRIAHGG